MLNFMPVVTFILMVDPILIGNPIPMVEPIHGRPHNH